MKSVQAELKDYIEQGNQACIADLYLITTIDNNTMEYTTWDEDITYDGTIYRSYGPLIRRNSVRCAVDLEVDNLEVTMMTGQEITLGGIPLQAAACNGALDGARVCLTQVFFDNIDSIPGGLVLFEGRVSEVRPSSTSVVITVKSDIELLNIGQPHKLFSPACQNCLYDANCTVTLVKDTAYVTSGSTDTVINSNLEPESDGYYRFGVLTMIDGVASGASRVIRSYDANVITLVTPLPVTPEEGDKFTVYPGCDHTRVMCAGKFINSGNFGGYPYVPRVEHAR